MFILVNILYFHYGRLWITKDHQIIGFDTHQLCFEMIFFIEQNDLTLSSFHFAG